MNLHRTVSLGLLVAVATVLAGCVVEGPPAYYDPPRYYYWHDHDDRGWHGEHHEWHDHDHHW